MAWRIVKQPNGMYARFSDVVDDFTHMDMTRAEALEECRHYPGMGAVEAEEKVAAADRDEWPFICEKPPGNEDGLYRWRDSLDRIKRVHGAAIVDERVTLAARDPNGRDR